MRPAVAEMGVSTAQYLIVTNGVQRTQGQQHTSVFRAQWAMTSRYSGNCITNSITRGRSASANVW